MEALALCWLFGGSLVVLLGLASLVFRPLLERFAFSWWLPEWFSYWWLRYGSRWFW